MLPQRIITILGLAKVLASVSQLVRALYVSRLEQTIINKYFYLINVTSYLK